MQVIVQSDTPPSTYEPETAVVGMLQEIGTEAAEDGYPVDQEMVTQM